MTFGAVASTAPSPNVRASWADPAGTCSPRTASRLLMNDPSDRQPKHILQRHDFHGEWNYTIHPENARVED